MPCPSWLFPGDNQGLVQAPLSRVTPTSQWASNHKWRIGGETLPGPGRKAPAMPRREELLHRLVCGRLPGLTLWDRTQSHRSGSRCVRAGIKLVRPKHPPISPEGFEPGWWNRDRMTEEGSGPALDCLAVLLCVTFPEGPFVLFWHLAYTYLSLYIYIYMCIYVCVYVCMYALTCCLVALITMCKLHWPMAPSPINSQVTCHPPH
jgi:hypothetical protein